MNKRYLRFNRGKQQKSIDSDENNADLERNMAKIDLELAAMKRTTTTTMTKLEGRPYISSNAPVGNPDILLTYDTQETGESFRKMKGIWKKAVFSIKKEGKAKPGAGLSKPDNQESNPMGNRTDSNLNTNIDPIYLMLRSAAYKATDGTEQPLSENALDQMKSEQMETDRLDKETLSNEFSSTNKMFPDSKQSSNEDVKQIKESVSASKLTYRRRLDTRMKSQSIDNPEFDKQPKQDYLNDSIYHQSKQLSSSFTNADAIESNQSSRNRFIRDRHRSISVENDEHENYRSNPSITSPRQSTRYINTIADDSKRSSQSSVAKSNLRVSRGNWKMKSFSVDTPDGETEMSSNISQYFHKANSHTSSPIKERSSHIRTSESPGGYENRCSYNNFQAQKRTTRPSHAGPNASDYHPAAATHHHRYHGSRGDSESDTYQVDNRRFCTNSYVVIHDFCARRSEELDLKSGWRVSVINCLDPDWWTGRCNGRVGYFPSVCVQKLHHGDSVWKIVRDICLDDDDGNQIRLRKGEIVVQQGSQDGESIPICVKRISYIWCPIDYVGKIFDDYI